MWYNITASPGGLTVGFLFVGILRNPKWPAIAEKTPLFKPGNVKNSHVIIRRLHFYKAQIEKHLKPLEILVKTK